uniref:TetR/AcrR family transcriptional regulator n=1 Tax=Marinobacterium profundum TaxID=1714300 RepID=UPI00082D6F76|nr:TetR/AcrR family transcriptional regulator [Marinobacterium profundum]
MVHIAKFDRDTVVRSAMALFWQRGFGGTSTRDLQQALKMHPGSIYAAFGNKAGLYREALDAYADGMGGELLALVEDKGSFVAGFKAFVRRVLFASQTACVESCMLVKTRMELDGKNDELYEHAGLHLQRMERLFIRLLDDDRQRGVLIASTPVAELARYLQIQLMGLRSYKACGGDKAAIEAVIERLFAGYET